MEPIFSLPYSEYETIVQIQRYFKKTDGFSVWVPVNRQQKGIDFIIMNTNNCKVLRFQVKSSRAYITENRKKADGAVKYNFWFNNFYERYNKGMADVYILFGLYPVYNIKKNIRSRTYFWKNFLLAFTDNEMQNFLKSIRTKYDNKPDKFFGIGFNDPNEIFVIRGREDRPNISNHLLKNKVQELFSLLT